MSAIKERWLWLRADVSRWWWRHGFTLVRKAELARLRHELHAARLGIRPRRNGRRDT